MSPNRRQFLTSLPVIASAVLSACSQSSPTTPTAVTPPVSNPTPQVPTSQYGTFYKEGFAGITGSFEEVLRAAGMNPQVNNIGLLTQMNGRSAPLPSGANPNNGAYWFTINGVRVGTSARETRMNARDHWVVFDWNGKTPA